MGKQLCASLLAVLGLLIGPVAVANDTGTVEAFVPAFTGLGRITLSQTGFVEREFDNPIIVPPGQSVDFTFTYDISMQDGGLPAPFDPSATGCLPIHVVICGPSFTGFEVVKAVLLVLYTDGRSTPTYIHQTGDNPLVVLQTSGDSFADSLSLSGTIHQTISNSDPLATFSRIYTTYLALWVLASPIPEPAMWVQLLAGLGMVGVTLSRRRAAVR